MTSNTLAPRSATSHVANTYSVSLLAEAPMPSDSPYFDHSERQSFLFDNSDDSALEALL